MSKDSQPVLVMFAGINGSGKSTLYNYQQFKYNADLGVRICPDEILVENEGNWEDYKDVYASGRVAHHKIDECIAKKQSFNWEFTLISNYVVKVLRRAKEAGFQTRLNFILVDDVEVSLKRIENRVKKGGHGIPEDVVRSRFERQLINMDIAIPMIDMCVFFDNEKYMKVVGLSTREQTLEFFDKDTKLTRELLKKVGQADMTQVK
jgi:predicted ABC-type ATPase